MCPYMDKEWDELLHIHLTREEDWDPSILDHEQSDNQDWYDQQPSRPLLFPVFDEHGDLHQHIEAATYLLFRSCQWGAPPHRGNRWWFHFWGHQGWDRWWWYDTSWSQWFHWSMCVPIQLPSFSMHCGFYCIGGWINLPWTKANYSFWSRLWCTQTPICLVTSHYYQEDFLWDYTVCATTFQHHPLEATQISKSHLEH